MDGDLQAQAVQVTSKTLEITASGLKALIQTLLSNRNSMEHGEQSLKKLNLQGRQLESIPLPGGDIKDLRRELNRYAVDFSIKKDLSTGSFTVFFKGQDVDRVYMGLEKCIGGLAKDIAAKKPVQEVLEEASRKSKERAASKQAPEKAPQKQRRQHGL